MKAPNNFFLWFLQIMYLNVDIGFANQRNEVSGRLGTDNGSGGDRPSPAGLSSASVSFKSSSSISTFPFC
jgi:hypothetical protein